MTTRVAVIGAGPAGLAVSRWLLSQGYLPAVAEGAIRVRPWLQSVAGTATTVGDGHVEKFDGQSGGYFVPLELQARWIAYTWGGVVEVASDADRRRAIAACRSAGPRKTRMDLAAVTSARAAGVEPRLERWPDLRRALLFGPLAPSCFRLEGRDALPDAPARFAHEAAAFGAITDNVLTDREFSYWSSVRDA